VSAKSKRVKNKSKGDDHTEKIKCQLQILNNIRRPNVKDGDSVAIESQKWWKGGRRIIYNRNTSSR